MAILSFTLALLPLILFIAAGLLFRRSGDRKLFLYLAWAGIALSALIVFGSWQTRWPYLASFSTVLSPVAAGAFALAVLNRSTWRDLRPMDRSLLGVGLLALAAFIAARVLFAGLEEDFRRADLIITGLTPLAVAAGLALAWTVGRRSPLAAGLIALAYLAAVNLLEFGAASFIGDDYTAGWQTAVYLGIPGLAVAVMAFLASDGFRAGPSNELKADPTAQGGAGPAGGGLEAESLSKKSRPAAQLFGRLGLALLVLAALIYTYVWLWIWDGIDDGIRGLYMLIVSGQAAAAAAIVIALTGPIRRIWIGPVFFVVVVAAAYGGLIGIGTRFDPYKITEARAARIGAAIDRYRLEEGAYPAKLETLVPGAFWRVPRPMIFADQGWCYESGPDFYRLGAVWRENWSSPIIEVRVYASAGNVPASGWVCDDQREVAQAQYGLLFNPPTPVPRPTGVVPVERTIVDPILQGTTFSVGSWSPDGAYLVFGLTRYYDDLGARMEIDLHFIAAATGEVCRAARPVWQAGQNSDGLRDHFAWLPDGRGLYVSDTGEMVALTPCSDAVEDLAAGFPSVFTHVQSAGPGGERNLVQDAGSYWLLDGSTLAAAPVEGLDLDPDDVQWAWYQWSPDGSRLVISVLTGPEMGALYIVDAAAGAVEISLPLAGASEASLPVAEWLSEDELLLHGSRPAILDLRSDPPGSTDLLRDIFLLDVDPMNDLSSIDLLPDRSGGGYVIGVRIDHPRNAGLYLYSSATAGVELLRHDTATLLFSPDGRWLRSHPWEDTPSYRDEYELAWPDRPGEQRRLVVEGHTPRAYPILHAGYLPAASQLYFYSSQGLSLVSLPVGETLAFWELAGAGDFFDVIASPGEEALVVVADGVGVYYISLDTEDDLQE